MADRIEELEANLAKAQGAEDFWESCAVKNEKRWEKAEANLAKAVKASVDAVWTEYTDSIESKWTFRKEHVQNAILRALAELKGETDE